MNIYFTCNGKQISLDVDPGIRVLDLLRDVLNLYGTKEGCGRGECGACTILMDGKAVNACLMYASKLDGREVLTIEGIEGEDGALHPVQESFLEEGAIQCGFCTPGMVLSTKALLDELPEPDTKEIEEALSGNMCRCTGYAKIIKAVEKSAERLQEKS